MKKCSYSLLIVLVLLIFSCGQHSTQQYKYKPAENMKTKNMVTIPELVNANIPGAPILSQPIQIQGEIDEIITEKHGYAYPALFDWNKDGKKDLLIGEFETGAKGSYLQIHLNEGTNEVPKYSGKFEYARDIKGDTITAYYWCCIGLHPRFVDLTGDGIKDLVTGSYNPGIISMWEGTENGFKPVVEVEQEGNPREYVMGLPFTNSKGLDYWNYTSVSFADFNNDGLYDLFVSGSGGLRVALNIGTKTKPKFGYRQLLLDPEGSTLYLADYKQMLKKDPNAKFVSGDMKSYIEPFDWDGDGIIDLLATSSYSYEGQNPIEFFRGVQTPKGIRFEQRKPLFSRKDGKGRPFPGSATQVKVEDFNNDGIPDLLIGMSILSVQDYRMVDSLAWKPLDYFDLPKVGKDLGHGYGDPKRHTETQKFQQMRKKEDPLYKIPWYYQRDLDQQVKDIYSSRHRGYVYVMYGQKSKTKAEVKKYSEAKDFVLPDHLKIKTENRLTRKSGPVTVSIEATKNPDGYEVPMVIRVKFKMDSGWYLYADTKHNRESGYVPTTIEFVSCEGAKESGKVSTPEMFNPEGVAKYQGKELLFEQVFRIGRKYFEEKNKRVDVKVTYQTCNKDMCLPPVTIEKRLEFEFKMEF